MADFATWYRREDYQRIREVMDDGEEMPATFDDWERRSKSTVARAKAAGANLEPVIIDPDVFIAFCARLNIPRDSESRHQFLIARSLARDLH